VTFGVEGDYWRDGAVCVRGAFDAEQIELAREAKWSPTARSPSCPQSTDDPDRFLVIGWHPLFPVLWERSAP
jgi:hypothetical protein